MSHCGAPCLTVAPPASQWCPLPHHDASCLTVVPPASPCCPLPHLEPLPGGALAQQRRARVAGAGVGGAVGRRGAQHVVRDAVVPVDSAARLRRHERDLPQKHRAGALQSHSQQTWAGLGGPRRQGRSAVRSVSGVKHSKFLCHPKIFKLESGRSGRTVTVMNHWGSSRADRAV